MNANDIPYDRLMDLFFRTSRLAPEQRSAYLRDACGGDRRLRAEVESLFAHDDERPEILETGGALARASRLEEPDLGAGYHVLRKIGEGGMGSVYLARQLAPIRRTVAVKLIKPGLETEAVLARFESERQALARMNHPNVAQVFDAGMTSHDRPFFAMELVDGEPITDYCDRLRLGIRERLDLFLQVCDGIQHAHQKAIIHRDIKPSNVLVTSNEGRPVPKIIDFGIAKAIETPSMDRTVQTMQGQWIGTPEYMSPEQADAFHRDTDTRSDVYSLGALLYELLTGCKPFELDGKGADEIRRIIREERPMPPSRRAVARAHELRDDLDWIVMKALEKRRSSRYPSASALVEDVRRFLRHEPLVARPPSRLYRLRKFVRKHRAGVAGLGSLLLVLVGFSTAMTVQAERIGRERDRANFEARRANEAAAMNSQVLDFLVGIFDVHSAREVGGESLAAKEILDRGLQKIENEFADRPSLRLRLSWTLAHAYERVHLDQRAVEIREAAREEALRTLGAEDPAVVEATAQIARGSMYSEPVKSEILFRELVAVLERQVGAEAPETLVATRDLARSLKMQRRLDEAEEMALEVVRRMEPVFDDGHPDLELARFYLTGIYLSQGRAEEAEPILRAQLEGDRGADTDRIGAVLYNLACIHAVRGEPAVAVDYLERSIALGFNYCGWGRDDTIVCGPRGIREDPDLASLRDYAPFEMIVGEEGYLTALTDAANLAWAGDATSAIEKLELAIERGLPNARYLESEEWRYMRDHPELRAIVASF